MSKINYVKNIYGVLMAPLLISLLVGFNAVQAFPSKPSIDPILMAKARELSTAHAKRQAILIAADLFDPNRPVSRKFKDYCQVIITSLESIENPEEEIKGMIDVFKKLRNQKNSGPLLVVVQMFSGLSKYRNYVAHEVETLYGPDERNQPLVVKNIFPTQPYVAKLKAALAYPHPVKE